MQKLSRSLIALGGLALLAACGDDVSITPPPEQPPATIAKVDVVPAQLTIKVAEKVILTASVTVNPGTGAPATTVTWTSANPAIASVSATGEVTGVAPGTTTIRATSTADPTKIGAAAITVAALAPATVSIKSVTTGTTNTPVNFNNVTGQIDVTLNVEPGDFAISAVEVLIDGEVACTQAFSGLKTAEEIAEAQAEIVCSIATNEFDPATGIVSYLNGVHQLSARAQLVGGTSVATPSTNLTFNNQSGFIALLDNDNTVGGPESAINPINGLKWIQGDVTLKLAAVNYTAGGATVTSISGAFLGHTFTGVTPDAGTQIFTILFEDDPAGDNEIDDYQTPLGSSQSMPVITSSSLSSGNQGPTQIVNIGAKADTLGLTRLDSTRVDNVVPELFTVGAFTTWVNAAFTFDTSSANITGVADLGVNAVTAKFYVIKGTLPTSACDVTGMTEVTGTAGLTETISTDWRGKVVISDALGNKRCAPLGNPFGADFGAPTGVALSGVSNLQAFTSTATAAGTNYTLTSTGDTLSGLDPTEPALISIVRTGTSTANNACVVGTGTFAACVPTDTADIASVTGGSLLEGYYTITAQYLDVAGNAGPTPPITRTYVVDETAPVFSGNLVLSQSTYAGNAPAQIDAVSVTDNLDLATLFGQVSYTALAGIGLEYATQSLGTFGPPLEKAFSGSYTIPSLIRCIAPLNTFAANNANKALDVTLFAVDQAGNFGTKSPTANDFNNRVTACGAVGNQGTFAFTSFVQSAPVLPTGKTQVDIDGASLATASSTTAALQAVATLALNAPNPFTRVEFYYVNPTTNGYVLAGVAAAGSPNQTTTERTWTYNFTWDPAAAVPVGTVTLIAIGIDAEGDAVVTGTQTVTTVQ